MRVPQPVGHKGSLMWVQRLVARRPDLAEAPLRAAGALRPGARLDWVSPLDGDERAEYRDADFLAALGRADLAPRLRAFWPARGPQWDALARADDGTVVLVEAKAHAAELASSCAATSPAREQIARALDRTRAALAASPGADWLRGYYQYANRLAHLHFLRAECGVPAYLLNLYIVGDHAVGGPETAADWAAPLDAARAHLGLRSDADVPGLVTAFVPVGELA